MQRKTIKPALGVGNYLYTRLPLPPAEGCTRTEPPRQPGVVGGKATAASIVTVPTSPGPLGTQVTSSAMEPHSRLVDGG